MKPQIKILAGMLLAISTSASAQGVQCLPCPAGTYAAAGATECTPCPAGKYCPFGTSAPQTCPSGQVPDSSKSTCTACAPGMYSNAGGASCAICPAGYYCPGNSDKKPCLICPSGADEDYLKKCTKFNVVLGYTDALSCIGAPPAAKWQLVNSFTTTKNSASKSGTIQPGIYRLDAYLDSNHYNSSVLVLIKPTGYFLHRNTYGATMEVYIDLNNATFVSESFRIGSDAKMISVPGLSVGNINQKDNTSSIYKLN
ncbi:MAG: hypothetical protein LBO78_00660 [Rickettsiales bacterium]|jgi:hypothetical protein|nr:hypothetical protein [Rickettsiales bacterium]